MATEMSLRYKKLWALIQKLSKVNWELLKMEKRIGMSRHPWPPYDFDCLYEHTCPYLDGLSTKWVLGEYRRADEVYHEHLRIIDNFREAVEERDKRIRSLERELAEVRAKYQALHRKQFKPNRRKDEAVDGQEEKSLGKKPKKRGAPVGHPGWMRPEPTRIDRTVPVPAPSVCPHCGSMI